MELTTARRTVKNPWTSLQNKKQKSGRKNCADTLQEEQLRLDIVTRNVGVEHRSTRDATGKRNASGQYHNKRTHTAVRYRPSDGTRQAIRKTPLRNPATNTSREKYWIRGRLYQSLCGTHSFSNKNSSPGHYPGFLYWRGGTAVAAQLEGTVDVRTVT